MVCEIFKKKKFLTLNPMTQAKFLLSLGARIRYEKLHQLCSDTPNKNENFKNSFERLLQISNIYKVLLLLPNRKDLYNLIKVLFP